LTDAVFHGKRWTIGQNVPWNASWTSEEAYEVRNCRWVGGRPALWQPHSPGEGLPVFARPHNVRQRRSIAELRCTVCGEKTPEYDRWWFGLDSLTGGWFMSTEAPVHHACAEQAAAMCPHIKRQGLQAQPMPLHQAVMSQIVGGPATDRDFGLDLTGRKVVGHLKLAWRPTPGFAARLRDCGTLILAG
jgi:hypothetical protein